MMNKNAEFVATRGNIAFDIFSRRREKFPFARHYAEREDEKSILHRRECGPTRNVFSNGSCGRTDDVVVVLVRI
jgi:hypothetical protein